METNATKRHTLSGLQDEGNTVPSLVLNIGDQSAEGGAARLLGHSVVLQVAGLAAVERTAVLSNDHVLGLDGIHRAQNTDLLVADILGGEGNGALHGEQGQHLQQVVLHDIADDAEFVKVTSTTLGAERLLKCDLLHKFTSETIMTTRLQQLKCLAIPGRCRCGDGSKSR